MCNKLYKLEVLVHSKQSTQEIIIKIKNNDLSKNENLKLIVTPGYLRYFTKIIPVCRQRTPKNKMTTLIEKNYEKEKPCLDDKKAIVELVDAANYLIQLYYKIEKKYSCNITKLGKLLSIAAFICAKNGVKLFEDDIVTYRCGTGFAKLGYHYLSDIIVESQDDDETTISKDDISNCAVYPSIYICEKDIPENIQALLLDVFLTYGAYPARTLGKLIDVFKDKFSTVSGTIDLNKVYLHFDNIIAQLGANTSVECIFCDYISNYLWD